MLTLDVRPDGVGILTYDVPGESVNTLTSDTIPAFHAILDRVERDATLRAVVLVSGKPESFVVGANLDMLKAVRTASDAEGLSREGQRGFSRIAASKKPFVAAATG